MKTLQEQYNQIQKGGGRKDLFLKEAKQKYPNLISNLLQMILTQTSKLGKLNTKTLLMKKKLKH